MRNLVLIVVGSCLLTAPCPAPDEKPDSKSKSDSKSQKKTPEKSSEKKVTPKKPVPKRRRAFLTPAKAGPDFLVQGEYTGEVHDGELKLGLQVIARGDGKFEAFAFPGGLPGAGWTGQTRIRAAGELDGDTAILRSTEPPGEVHLRQGTARVLNDQKKEIGTLRRTIRKSPTLGRKPPQGAIVLFDGRSAERFHKGRLIDGMLREGMTSKDTFGSFRLHMEFMLSYMPWARGQGRSNSGVYMQGRYEVQILDSFGLAGEQNECGGIYGIAKPKVNMCLPPLSWQTYDIEFHQALFDSEGKRTKPARMTVSHNGVVIHENVSLPKSTTAAPRKTGPEPGPLYIQDHRNPLRFRNIWIEPIKETGRAISKSDESKGEKTGR